MKVLSIAIPSYNSQDYMANCIESLLVGGEDVEILVVDDGSKDNTAKIADEYAAKYPTIVRAIHQENGGHGEAVNAGIRNATGVFYKVVDSDDKVDADALRQILAKLKEFIETDEAGNAHGTLDLHWEDLRKMPMGKYILMHSVIYRTQLLRDCGLELPKHTFYVDNLFVFNPLPHVETIYYLDVNFYLYYIGREDQSVNEQIMIKRIDQQLRVNRLMIDKFTSTEFSDGHVKQYMRNYLEIITAISSVLAIRSKDPENLKKMDDLWDYMKEKDSKLYYLLRSRFIGAAVHLPGKIGRGIVSGGYKIAQKIYGADGVDFTAPAKKQLKEIEELGFDKMPVCMAKTQYSLSDDAAKLGRPEGFRITVRELRIAAGAGFIVALTGNILTMPGLPKKPAAENMDIDESGKITGLF